MSLNIQTIHRKNASYLWGIIKSMRLCGQTVNAHPLEYLIHHGSALTTVTIILDVLFNKLWLNPPAIVADRFSCVEMWYTIIRSPPWYLTSRFFCWLSAKFNVPELVCDSYVVFRSWYLRGLNWPSALKTSIGETFPNWQVTRQPHFSNTH